MKTISMRIRGAKTELEDMGESTDGMVESTATLRAEIKALSGVDIMASATEFKSTYQILDELSQKWENLTDIQQASIIELMAGKHQGNVFSSIMTNFQTARDALDTSLGSSGSAMAEHAKWSESLEASLNKLKAAWQSLAQTFMDSSFLKVGMEAIISLVSVLDKLLDTLGSLGTIGLGTSIFSLFKTKGTGFKTGIFGALSDFGSTVSSIMSSGDGLIKKFKGIGKAAGDAGGSITKSFGGSLSAAVTGIGLAVTAISLLYNAYKKAKEAAAEARREAIEDSNEYLDAAFSFEKAYIKYSGKTNLTTDEEAELTSAINSTVDALNDKSSALQNVVDNNNDYVTSLEEVANAELQTAYAIAKGKRDNAELGLKDLVKGWSTWEGGEVNVKLPSTEKDAIAIAKELDSGFIKKIFKPSKEGGSDARSLAFYLPANADIDEILDYYYTLIEYRERLSDEGMIDTTAYDNVNAVINKMSESIKVYEDSVYDAAKAQYQLKNGIPKTVEEYLEMRESILRSENVKGLHIDSKRAIASTLDSEYGQIFDLTSAEVQARKLVGIIKAYGNGKVDGTNEIGTVETFLNMRTAVNNNECTVGEYLSQFNKVNNLTRGKDGAGNSWSKKEKEVFNTTLGLDTDSIKQQYADMRKYLLREAGVNLYEYEWNSSNSAFAEVGNAMSDIIDKKTADDPVKYKISSFLDELTADELEAVIDIRAEIDWKNSSAEDIRKQIEDQVELNRAMRFNISIDVETSGIDNLNTALAESKSAIGLTAESINALKDRYKDLDGYNAAALFEETANGIRVNSTELAKLEKEYKDFNKQEIDKTLKTLEEEYYKLTDEINNCTDDQAKLNSLYRERDAVLSQINNVASLASQYEGLTSAYNEWMKAKEAGQDRDMYESIISGREEIEEEMSLGWLDDAGVEYLELLTGKELSTAGIDAQIAAYKDLDKTIEGTKYSLWDFLTVNEEGKATSDGVYNFFDAVKSATNETAAWVDENGKYHFDFEGFEYNGKTGDAAIAEMLGTSEEFVQTMLKTAEDAGFVINIEGEYTDLANASDDIHDLNKQLKSIGATSYTFNVNTSDLSYANEQIAEAESALQYFENRDGKINLDDSDVRAAATILTMLVFRKSELGNPTLMSLDVSEPTTKLEEVLGLAQQLKNAKANLEIQTAIGADTTEAQAEIDSLLTQLSSDKYADITAGLKIDTTSVDSAIASINAVSGKQMIELGLDTSKIDGYVADNKDATVTYSKDSTEVDEYDPPDFTRTVTFNVDSYSVDIYDPSNLTRTVTYKIKTEGEVSEANGTANANGTAFANGNAGGRAFKQGNWGIKDSGSALGGELGTEILVRDGRWYTIGEHGAEFFNYRKGDIIFNHRQTEELFSNGKVTSGSGRGKSFANGNAFAFGSSGFGSLKNIIKSAVKEVNKDKKSDSKNGSSSSSSSPSGSSTGSKGDGSSRGSINGLASRGDRGSGGGSSKDKDEFEETIDWIEVAIDRIERAIDQLDQKANNIYKSWADRNTALADQIGKVREEIELQQRAYDRYLQEAESVGLSEDWAAKVRDGKVDIEKELKEYEKGGNVNLTLRPEVDTSVLNDAGWDIATGEVATVFTSTFSDETGNIAMNFTPIIADENGNYIGTLSPDELQRYAEEVISGVREDDLNLQIGGKFKGEDAIQQAEIAAQRIHELQELYYNQESYYDIETIKDEALAEKIKDYQEWYEKALDCKDAIEGLKETEASLYQQRLENVATQYEGILGVIEHEKNMLEEYINQSETQAWLVSSEYYNALANNERDNIAELEKQKAEMLSAFNEAMDSGTIVEGSEAWHSMCSSIDEVTLAITESETQLKEYEQTIQQLSWESFDLLQDKISSVTEETEFLIELLSSDKLFDDRGQLTDSGMATMGQHGVAYNTYMHQADQAAQEAARLKAELENDPFDTELEERYREMISLQQEYILSAQGEKEAIRDLVSEGIELELDALQELIDKKNEALQSEKDLYEYQKRVKEQTEEIASLEKQMAAYSGDDSEEAKQKIQQIKVDLESARQDLQETEYDKLIDDSAAMLDELYLEYETVLNARLDNIDALLESMIEEINANAVNISETLSAKADSVGYTLSDSMSVIWDKNSVSTQNVITAYSEKFITAQTTTNTALNAINTNLQNMISLLNAKATANAKSASTSSVAKSSTTKTSSTKTTTTKKSTSGGDGTPKIGDKVKFVNGQYYYDSYGMRPLGSQKQGQYVYITNINNRKGATHPYHISTGTRLGSGDLGWLKLNQITGYATGKKNFLNDEIAWTQEGSSEFIVRPSDGAILTPIAKGDSVLTSAASRNIWDMANSPAEFIRDNLNLGSTNVPNDSNVQNNYTQIIEKVIFDFENVKNYEEMLYALKDDRRFEKLITAMTIDKIAGKSSLAKGKSVR